MEFLRLLIICLVGCAVAAGACAAYISTEAESGTRCPFHVSVVYTAMLRTSIASVVHGCFYFCPLGCGASVIVVDCAAVETGCMLEKYIPAKGCNKIRSHFYFWSRCCCCCCCVLLLLPTTSVLKRTEVLLFLFGGCAAAALHSSRGM